MISERATDIFLEAKTLDPQTRDEYLRVACADSAYLRREVESMLDAASSAEAYFDNLAGKVSFPHLADDEETSIEVNRTIGSWRLLRRIARGGMGTVYLAERADGQFEHTAALKVLPTGVDSDHARARFLIERQILARLVHDNIARLLDGGVADDGVPYFVMDYVDGLPIDEYCQRHALDIDQRLRLVLDVAGAVQYAHRNLVIHRDLKPSNVLVDSQGQVRLLDFGIAKMLDPDPNNPNLTRESRRPATPAYASPEMLRGEPVDMTTDVYSIGALMYVLLTGNLPLQYDGLSLTELCERASNSIPEPPSRHYPALDGDLDAIVAKALAKEPDERYESVQSLAHDIGNYLDGLPISAKAPSAAYRARKFVARNRASVAFSAFAVVALVSIAVLAVRSAIVSERQSQQIALERDRAEQTKDFLVSIFNAADPNIVPGEQTARDILEAGRQRIEEELAEQPEVQADLLRAMSAVYQNWRETDDGRAVLERELQLREQVNGTKSEAYADTLVLLAYITEIGGDYESSIDYARRALQTHTAIGNAPGQASSHERIGRVLHLQGDYDKARSHFEQSLELIVENGGADSEDAGFIMEHLGNLLTHQEQYEAALAMFEQSLAVRRKHIQGDNSEISAIYLGMGTALNRLGRYDDAVAAYEEGIAINERLFGADNSYTFYFMNGLGKVAESRGDLATAARRYDESRRLIIRYMPESPNLAFATANVGKMLMMSERFDEAISYYRDSIALFEVKLPNHWAMGATKWRLGLCLVESGKFTEAEPLILEGIEIVEARWGAQHEETLSAREAAERLYQAWGKPRQEVAHRSSATP